MSSMWAWTIWRRGSRGRCPLPEAVEASRFRRPASPRRNRGELAMPTEGQEQELLQALRHPLRRSLLRLCVEERESLSPKELALVVRKPLSNVAYHAAG